VHDGVGSDPRAGGWRGRTRRRAHTSFAVFARRQRRSLVALAWTLTGDLGAAEEVAQDALHATWQAWNLGRVDHPDSWARRVVANRAIDRVRRAGRERRALALLAAEPDRVAELPTTDHEFWHAVRALPARQAQVIALHYVEDRSVAEIAEILGCAGATVKVHLHRGRRALADSLPDTSVEER
jgi:RNA polymerase sigma-70 factor, ECF subfamily